MVTSSSKRLKHMQLVPVTDIPIKAALPINAPIGKPRKVAAPPFHHAFVQLDDSVFFTDPVHAALQLQRAFEEARASCGFVERDGEMSSYNVLAMRRWLMVAPRLRKTYALCGEYLQISDLLFAGRAFATRPEQLHLIE